MNIYENNKQLLTVMGGDSYNLATDYEVRKAILDTLGGDSSICSNIYEVDKQILKIFQEGCGGTSGGGEKAKVLTLEIDDSCIVDGTWGAESIDTSLMTKFNQMFMNCKTLTKLDVSGWNTSNVTDMYSMFYGCSSLQTLDVSGWDTSKLKYMSSVFFSCKSLTQLDVSNWDTSNVTTMRTMFYHCNALTQLDVSGWNTSNVTDMYSVFSNCNALTQLDVSGWNTSNVTNMSSVFGNCNALTQLDLTNWDASKVTSINTFCDLGTFNSNSLNVVGGLTYDEVVLNNICILNGLSVSANKIFGHEADSASYRALINGLADLTGSTTQNLSFYSLSRLTDEDIAIATAKNWTISKA